MSYSLLAATVNAARGDLPKESHSLSSCEENGRKKRNIGSGSNGSSTSDSQHSTEENAGSGLSSEHPTSSKSTVTPREIVAAALNLGSENFCACFQPTVYQFVNTSYLLLQCGSCMH